MGPCVRGDASCLDDAGRRIKHDFGWNMQVAVELIAVERLCIVIAAISCTVTLQK
jgi:hypothetical protein